MKRVLSIFFFVVLLSSVGIWASCSSNSNPVIDLNDPSTLPGTYKVMSMTDKTGEDFGQVGLTVKSGVPVTVDLGEGVTATITFEGTLVLTETRYTFSMTIKTAIPGLPEQSTTETDTGTYSIDGTTMTINSDDPQEGTDTATVTVDGNKLTIDNSSNTIVLEKQ